MHIHVHTGGGHGEDQSGPSLPDASETSSELVFLDPKAARFRHEGSRLKLRQDGQEDGWQTVSVVRLFPLSDPEGWIGVLDEKGKEIGVLLNLRGMARRDLARLREELRRRYLVPEIRRVISCRDRFDMVEWTVETDRGRATFLTRSLREQVKQPWARRLAITDVEGNRYDIPGLDALDRQSRGQVEMRL